MKHDYCADRFQIVLDCSIISIVNNRRTPGQVGPQLAASHSYIICFQFVVLIGWVVALLGMFFIVFGTAWRPYCEVCAWKTPVEITYRIMSRNGFVTCLSWVIFACATGYGGL